MGIHLNSRQSPASLRLKNKPRCCPGPKSGGHRLPEPGWGGSRQTCQLRASSSHQHGAPASCLKIASGVLLKMLTLQLTFGGYWQAIKPELKIRAAGRGQAAGSRDQAGWGPGHSGLDSLPWLRLNFLPTWLGIWLSAGRTQGRRRMPKARKKVEGEWIWRDLNLLVHPQTPGHC